MEAVCLLSASSLFLVIVLRSLLLFLLFSCWVDRRSSEGALILMLPLPKCQPYRKPPDGTNTILPKALKTSSHLSSVWPCLPRKILADLICGPCGGTETYSEFELLSKFRNQIWGWICEVESGNLTALTFNYS